MPAITKAETISFQDLFKKSYIYLNDNFHKFKQTNKIQVAIAVCKMAVPQKMEHSGGITVQMPTIQREMPSGEAMTTPINRVAEYFIGSPNPPENS